MTIKRALMLMVLVVSVAALAVPLIGVRASAPRSASSTKGVVAPRTGSASVSNPRVATQEQLAVADQASNQASAAGSISAETLKALGINRVPKGKLGQIQSKVAQNLSGSLAGHITPRPAGGRFNAPAGAGHGEAGPPLVGQPVVLNVNDALSAALITNIGGRDNQFSEVALIADWDGREDCAADRGVKIDDFSFVEPEIDFSLTRAAISEHTRGNGHPFFNVYYYGDTIGNTYMGVDVGGSPLVDIIFSFNVPALVNTGTSNGFNLLNRTAGDCTDDQVTVTGIAVNPVADLGDFDPALCGTTGEVVYVSVFDSEGCASNAANQPIRTRIFAFGLFEGSNAGGGFVALTNVRQILRSKFANIAGVAVDDDGSLYYQLLDLIQFTGGAIFKATEICRTVANCAAQGGAPEGGVNPPRINRVINLIPDPPTLNSWSSTTTPTNPVVIANGVYNSNYGGGMSRTWGNVVSLSTGACNVLYAAVARSFRSADDGFTQSTEGRFEAPNVGFPNGATPSMVISLADCSGAFDICSGVATGSVAAFLGGVLPVADGIADPATASTTSITPGVNNFRIFVQGDGPDLAPAVGGTAVVPGTPPGLLKVAMQIDYTLHSGIAVSEEGSVFVISGGTPAGIGTNPSPLLGEILCFEDMCPMDRRADFVDLRGDTLPNPPASGGNVGDGDSDRFDHIFFQSPLDQVTLTPAGLAGLARGFLRYTNRLVGTNALAVPLGPGVTLGSTTGVLGDDDTSGQIIFENLDPGHQVAGGDDQNTPFRGDDDNGAGNPAPVPALPGQTTALNGGFEFTFGGPVGAANCVWNGFFLNSNGNITFGVGDPSGSVLTDPPNVPNFRQGPPKIAPAWADLNPSSRDINLCTFPVQALGFANVNAFRVRWINVPEFGNEDCVGNSANFAGATNTFSVTLYDDGTGIDENASQPLNPANPIGNNSVPFDLQEGPTDLRFTREPNTALLVGCPPRPEGSGIFLFEYCRMDLLGTEDSPVIAGYSIGGLDPLNPPGLCETNLSVAAAQAETTFGVLSGNQVAAIGCNCLIGEGTEPTIFELFNEGLRAHTGAGGEQVFATPDFDLRFEGNDTALCTSTRQHDFNRGKVGFLGIGCAPPATPICRQVVAGPFVTTPGSGTDLVDSICAVPLQIVGCGFFPNEVTTICQGFEAETGVPLQRPGKTVSTAATLSCDTNGDGVPESTVALVNVTPVSCNLIRATIPVLAAFGTTSTSGFPPACCGGAGTVTITTTFSSGDNNAFGPFTRTVVCSIALGTRAPIVISVSPSSGSCSVPQDLLITGACFIINGVPNVTSVFAIDRANSATRINATNFFIVNANLIDALFNFTSANAGKTFLIFVQGPGGISRNLTALPAGTPTPCFTGNEQGIQVTFTCSTSTTPGGGNTPDIAVLERCKLNRDDVSGAFTLDVFGTNIKLNAAVTINGQTPKKVQFKDLATGSTDTFTRVRLKKQVCKQLNGAASIVITNPGAAASVPLLCAEKCPTN